MSSLRDTIEGAKSDLLDHVQAEVLEYECVPGGDLHDTIHEIADSSTPIYYSEILNYVREDVSLAMEEPDVGRGKDAMQDITWNICDRITQALHAYWEELKEKCETDLQALEDLRDALEDAKNVDEALDAFVGEEGDGIIPEYLWGLATKAFKNRKKKLEEDNDD